MVEPGEPVLLRYNLVGQMHAMPIPGGPGLSPTVNFVVSTTDGTNLT